MYQPRVHTQPINCNIISQKDTMKVYMAQTRNPLNSQVMAKFFPSAAIPAIQHYSEFTDKYSPQYGRLWFLYFTINILFSTSISHFQSFSQSLSQSNPLPNHHPYQQPHFPFPATHPIAPVCTQNQQQNTFLKSSKYSLQSGR